MDKQKIEATIEEAVKILNDYPHLKFYQAVALAKEILKYRKNPTRL